MMINAREISLLDRACYFFGICDKRNAGDFREDLLYKVLSCRRRTELDEEQHNKTVRALTQLLHRAAIRGMDRPPEEVAYWYLDPSIRSDELEAHIEVLADKRHITRQDFVELFL